MANSRKSRSTELAERVAAQLAPLVPAHSSILLGLSGGVDSVVLLHLLHQLAPRFSWQLSALHVHHGISSNADAWADFCAGLCAGYAIPLYIEHVDIAPLRAHGIEAAARQLRHAAFARQAADFVVLAHHADDQAETLLLQLLRGAGVKGASAMPLFAGRSGAPGLLRPLLHSSRREILDYAAAHRLRWIEDESNADASYPRNFLRHRVLPLLEEKFPACRDTLARSAQHFAEASELLDDLARLDAPDLFPAPITSDPVVDVRPPDRIAGEALNKSCSVIASSLQPREKRGGKQSRLSVKSTYSGSPRPYGARDDEFIQRFPSGFIGGGGEEDSELCLEVSRLQSLPQSRAKNLLRWFLHCLDAPMPQAVQLDDMLRQLCGARRDAAVCVAFGGWEVRRYQGKIYALRALNGFDRNLSLPWQGEAVLDWHALNAQLTFAPVFGQDISLAKLQRAPVTLRLRRGGETLRPHPNAATRTLKNLLQEHNIPPWQRERLPLLYCGDELACVAGVAVAAEYQAGIGEAAVAVQLHAAHPVA